MQIVEIHKRENKGPKIIPCFTIPAEDAVPEKILRTF